jgi:hypothetical protein
MSPLPRLHSDYECPERAPEVKPVAIEAKPRKTTAEWEQWARERREYEDPYGYDRSRY